MNAVVTTASVAEEAIVGSRIRHPYLPREALKCRNAFRPERQARAPAQHNSHSNPQHLEYAHVAQDYAALSGCGGLASRSSENPEAILTFTYAPKVVPY